MTPKKVITVALEEIKAVEVHCVKCGGFVSFPIQEKDPYFNCPSCGIELTSGKETRATQALVNLLEALNTWENRTEKKPFRIRFTLEDVD